jgi:pSer/pThr/pTyr-binding forkhead associated (FHA) protein
MAKLILSMDGLVLKEIPLSKERMTIGRKPQNDIQIDNLAISGEHAVIVTILNDSFLEDMNSTNGTLINGQVVKKHFLQNGDVIELGKYRLKYVAEATQQSSSPADFEKTMILRPDMMRKTTEQTASKGFGDTQVGMKTEVPASRPPEAGPTDTAPRVQAAPPASPPPAAAAPLTGALQVLTGANAGKELVLTKTLTTLGKPGVQVAVIARRPHGYFLTHVEGAQFPIINGRPLDSQAHLLADHDIIELAGIKMEFFIKG